MEREILNTKMAPKAAGPYSHVVKYGDLIFISGQISLDVNTGKVIKQDIAGQTRTVMGIIKNILEDVGSSMDKVLKCQIHLSEEKYFDEMNEVYGSFFTNGYPARITVYGAKLYSGLDIEIDVIAGI